MTSGSFSHYCRDEMNGAANKIIANYRRNNNKTTRKSFEYMMKIRVSTPANSNRLDVEVVVPLKYLSNFLRFLDLPLINCEIELDLIWSINWVISEILRTPEMAVNPNANSPVQEKDATKTNGATI